MWEALLMGRQRKGWIWDKAAGNALMVECQWQVHGRSLYNPLNLAAGLEMFIIKLCVGGNYPQQ